MFHMSHSTNIYGNFTKIHQMASGLIVETSCVVFHIQHSNKKEMAYPFIYERFHDDFLRLAKKKDIISIVVYSI